MSFQIKQCRLQIGLRQSLLLQCRTGVELDDRNISGGRLARFKLAGYNLQQLSVVPGVHIGEIA